MKLSQFKFKLPEERIAQEPARFRDECRLMVIHAKSGVIEHRESFRDILNYIDEKDVFVFNDTKVFPARLYGNKEKTGAKIEVFLLRELNEDMRLWDVLVDPARKIRIGNKLYFGDDETLVAEVIDNTTSRGRTLRFLYDGDHDEFKRSLYALGEAPLPRFVGRDSEPEDLERFQCIFARNEGAVTAPTAGLHFSREMMKRLEIKGIEQAFVTLHCGLGNFRDTDVEDLTKHKMDSEQMEVNHECCRIVNKAKDERRHILAVGTTVQRALEASCSADQRIKEFNGWTNKFIFPPYDFTMADAMVANFYMPESTMLMLTCAYGGYETVLNKAYREAVKKKFPILDRDGNPVLDAEGNETYDQYRFGTYGDAMLILKD